MLALGVDWLTGRGLGVDWLSVRETKRSRPVWRARPAARKSRKVGCFVLRSPSSSDPNRLGAGVGARLMPLVSSTCQACHHKMWCQIFFRYPTLRGFLMECYRSESLPRRKIGSARDGITMCDDPLMKAPDLKGHDPTLLFIVGTRSGYSTLLKVRVVG
jgi:hypothetical protein